MSNLYFRKSVKDNLANESKKHLISVAPVIALLPSIVTLTALCLGLSAINLAMNGNYKQGALFIIIACILDGIDGRLARLLNAASVFGAELDSLSDFLNFGVAPAMLMHFWLDVALPHERMLSWSLVMFSAICMAIRLARFNARSITKEENTKPPLLQGKFFEGIPAPCGAFLVILPLIVDLAFGYDFFFNNPYLVLGIIFVVAFLSASTLPTISAKKIGIKEEYTHLFLICIALLIIGFIYKVWFTLTILGVCYIISLPLGAIYYVYLSTKATKISSQEMSAVESSPDSSANDVASN